LEFWLRNHAARYHRLTTPTPPSELTVS
jgi:hypothetical protein